MLNFIVVRIAFAVLTLASAACAPEPPIAIEGSVTYVQRIAMPPIAVARVYVVRLGASGVPGPALAETNSEPPFRVPMPFRIEVDRLAVAEPARYQLRGEITVDDQLAFFGFIELGDDAMAWPREVDLIVKPAQ